MKGEVLVKAMKPQMDSSGRMSYVMDVGGRESGRRPLTTREKIGGLGGRLVGVLGALTGKHRSLSGLLGSAYAGGMQGAAVGRGLAGATVTPAQREAMKVREQLLAEQARTEGQAQFDATRAQPPLFSIRGRNAAMLANEDERLAQITQQNRMMDERNEMMRRVGTEAGKASLRAEAAKVKREDLARARSLRDLTPAQIEELGRIAPERLEQLRNIEAVLSGNVPSTYAAVSQSPTLQQLVPNAQPVQPLQHSGGAAGELQAPVPPEAADHASGTHPGDNTSHAAELGQQLAQEEPTNTLQMSADQLRLLLEMGQQR